MGRRLAAIVLMALVLAVAQAAHASYRGTLRSVTHRGQLYNLNTWDAEIEWYGTFFDEGLRQAYITKALRMLHLDPPEAEAFEAEQLRRQANGWDFFVVIYTKKDYRKFSLDTDTFWKAVLTTASGEIVKPVEIESLPITPFLRILYPHFNRWSRAYRVTFPKVDLGDQFWMTLESVVGESSVKWVVPTAEQKAKIKGNKYRQR